MSHSNNEPLSDPRFDALAVEMEPAAGGDLQAPARQALAATLQALSIPLPLDSWDVRPVHADLPLLFDMVPLAANAITVEQGFDMQYHLAAQDTVRSAEAYFETTVDNIPDTAAAHKVPAAPTEPGGMESLSTPIAELLQEEKPFEWALNFMKVPNAWESSDPDKRFGRGVVIGHPDSGYLPHPDFTDERLRHDLERDFYDTDVSAENLPDRGGSHGLGTGSVIISNKKDPQEGRFIIGVAPQATIVPMRIVQKGPPLFFHRSGPRRVREAVFHAIDSDCHIISMSMGGIWHGHLHQALQLAYCKNILLIAAAGNVVRMVVWPARYKEVIAVAGCTATGERWVNSSRGADVDITAPAHNIWRACVVDNDQDDPSDKATLEPGSGTSYATALTAGVAALWLAHHGRDELLERYAGIPLNEVFRKALQDSADPPPPGHDGKFGRGILNAERLLNSPLPPRSAFSPTLLADCLQILDRPDAPQFEEVFEDVPESDLHARLSATMETPESNLEAQMAGVGTELLFHIVTTPALREIYIEPPDEMEAFGVPQELHNELLAVPGLSSRLRGRVEN